ncbi:DMT family transporter [Streptomyces broussonetiae]|uniref:EamA family transporter n=1 Tax=Streptomyces broussonetiae TaxID=2686304 RepID=A0A6I6N7H1_9ACTN|nr:DMT family transporter [Streptomyces broussonetiae]QHA08883.1 EamA family transporter [Streptomyces broussonetiae]
MVTDTSPHARGGGPLVVPALSVLMVALLAVGWLLAGHLVDGAPPLAVAAGRTTASFVVITVVALLYPRSRSEVRVATARGGSVALLAFLGFFAYYSGTLLGTGFIGASRVGLIVSLLPCITFVIGVVAFREPSTRRKVLGTVLAVVAACGYALADASAGDGAGSGAGSGALVSGGLLALGGTFTYAVYGYVYRRRMPDLTPVAALPAITGAGTVMLGLTVVLFVPLGGVSAADWGGIAILGAVLTAPVFLISHELILRKGPLFTSALALVVPFLVRLGEWALGREAAPGPLVLLLLLLCAGGVWLTIGGARPAERAPAQVHTRPGTEVHTRQGTS